MPLIALLDNDVRVDATDFDDTRWQAVWRAQPRRSLTCRECHMRLDAVERLGTRFFRHFRRVDCSSVNESAEHLRLKARLAAAVRAAGWTALIEEPIPPRRADLLAVSPDRRRVAVEIQLSAQLAQDTRARTCDYTNAGVETLWIVQDPARLGVPREDVRWLVLDQHDRATKPLLRMHTSKTTVWDGRQNQPVTAARWRQVDKTADLDATVAAIFDERVVWLDNARGWVPAADIALYEAAAATEAAARADAEHTLQQLRDIRQRELDGQLAIDSEGDPLGYRTAVRVAERLTAAGYGNPTIVRAGTVLANGWRVENGKARVVVDPDPVHFDRVFRSRIGYRRFTVRTNVRHSPVVASAERYDELARELGYGVHHVDGWQPEAALLPSPDGRPVTREHLEAARHVITVAQTAFSEPVTQPTWQPDDHAWVWSLPDGATAALAAAAATSDPPTPTGAHRMVVYLNRYVLRQDRDRKVIWRNVAAGHLTGEIDW